MRIFGRFKTSRYLSANKNALWLFVQCNRCQEKIKLRIDKTLDLESEFPRAGREDISFVLKKEILGNKCFNLINVDLGLDRKYKAISSRIEGGRFITEKKFYT